MENQISMGMNRTGVQMAPLSKGDMIDFARNKLAEAPADDGGLADMERRYIVEAEAVGSVPIPATLRGMATTTMGKLGGMKPEVLIDKLGERLAFERTGTRLYEALIRKCAAMESERHAASGTGASAAAPMTATGMVSGGSPRTAAASSADADLGLGMPDAGSAIGDDAPAVTGARATDSATLDGLQVDLATLMRIHDEEAAHFQLVQRSLTALGADPTAMTPCADIAGVMSMGLMQTVTDPRTSVPQCLNAILTAELADNAGWELLIEITHELGHDAMADEFATALAEERNHLAIVKGWLRGAVMSEAS